MNKLVRFLKHKTNGLKTRDEEKSSGKHHVSNNKQEQAKKTIEISTSARSHHQTSAVKQHQTVINQSPQPTSNNKITQTKRDESQIGGDPKFAYNTQTFMIQVQTESD